MIRLALAIYLAIGVLFQYWAYGDSSLIIISTLIHILFWVFILLATSFWYIVLAVLFCIGVGIIYFLITNYGAITEVRANRERRNNPDLPSYPEASP